MLRLEVPVELAALEAAQDRIAAYLAESGVAQASIQRLRLVVEELLANLVMHGRYAIQPPPASRLTVRAGAEGLCLVVEDAAAPFDPRDAVAAAPPGSAEDIRIGGLGLKMVRQMAEIRGYGAGAPGWNRTELWIRDPGEGP
jgi:anti-sigma regulatory factor (Ser/Thr protein kinase)